MASILILNTISIFGNELILDSIYIERNIDSNKISLLKNNLPKIIYTNSDTNEYEIFGNRDSIAELLNKNSITKNNKKVLILNSKFKINKIHEKKDSTISQYKKNKDSVSYKNFIYIKYKTNKKKINEKKEKYFYLLSLSGYWQNQSLDSLKKTLKNISLIYSNEFIDSTKLLQPFNNAMASINIELSLYYPYLVLNSFITGVSYSYSYLNESYKAVIMYYGQNFYTSEKRGFTIINQTISLDLLMNINNQFIKLDKYNAFFIKSTIDYHFNTLFQFYTIQNSELIKIKENHLNPNIGFSLGLLFFKKTNNLSYNIGIGMNFLKMDPSKNLSYSDLSPVLSSNNIEFDMSGIYFNFGVGF